MSMTWSSIANLHPKATLAQWYKALQGNFVATQFLPERKVPQPTFVYRYYGELGGMTPESSDLAQYQMSSTEYSEQMATCVLYKEKDLLSEQIIKFSVDIRDVVKDATQHLIDRLVLRQEYLVMRALADNALNVIDLADGDATRWNEENANPLDDLVESRRLMHNEGFVPPDTLLINSDTEADFLRNVDIREWSKIGPYGQMMIKEAHMEGGAQTGVNTTGLLGRLRGMDVYVTNAFYLKEARTAPALERRVKLLNNQAIAFKRDPELGFMGVAMPFSSKTWEDQERDGINVAIKKMMVPVVTRPQYVVTFDNVRAEDW